MLAFVWAEDQNHLIGKAGKLPWYLPNDLQFFKDLTSYQTIVMGRKTFEGMGKRLLPNRHTIILTHDKDYEVPGAEVVTDYQDIILDAAEEDIYIVGGSQIYQLFAGDVDVLYRTVIEAEFSGDSYFPELDWEQFSLVKTIEGIVDSKNLFPHRFEMYHRMES
ncbi:dihydrofolate reductase [Granulicatella balaenopterae]|uniref:Dihydrofolate reductase n=1 Tax=Granulicatella balaenopterae TaxID=137733 RepID=A0A1H9K2R6_9LACT|nr:dihydrofolate reductase [Granulicatella balaenopterae]SEQ93369.1 dihydrofolate reductase [Granulicatella balaenopterae]